MALFQEAAAEDAEPEFDLVEPRAVDGREVHDVFVRGVGQVRHAVGHGRQLLRTKRQAVEAGEHLAHFEAAVRVQVVEDPVIFLPIPQSGRRVVDMCGEVDVRVCLAEVGVQLAAMHREGRNQRLGVVTEILVLALRPVSGFREWGGMLAFEDLQAGLLIGRDDDFALLGERNGAHVELQNLLGLGVELGIVTRQPILAQMRLEIDGIQNSPNGGQAHLDLLLPQHPLQVGQVPVIGHTVMLRCGAGGDVDDLQLFRGGKSSVADPTAEHPSAPEGLARCSVPAT